MTYVTKRHGFHQSDLPVDMRIYLKKLLLSDVEFNLREIFISKSMTSRAERGARKEALRVSLSMSLF